MANALQESNPKTLGERASSLFFGSPGRLLLPQQISDCKALRGLFQTRDELPETLGKQVVPKLPIVDKAGGGEVRLVEVAPAAPDLLLHQSLNVVEMDHLHRLEKLEGDVIEPRFLVRV